MQRFSGTPLLMESAGKANRMPQLMGGTVIAMSGAIANLGSDRQCHSRGDSLKGLKSLVGESNTSQPAELKNQSMYNQRNTNLSKN